MALLMARPWKDPKSGVWHLRQRVPQDLLRLKGHTITLPVGDRFSSVRIGEVVQVSLRTKDQREAKERHAAADAALRRFWGSQRNSSTQLDHKQAVALAGTLYKSLAEGLEGNPGSPEKWANLQDAHQRAREGKVGWRASLMIGKEAARNRSMAEVFGPLADGLLAR